METAKNVYPRCLGFGPAIPSRFPESFFPSLIVQDGLANFLSLAFLASLWSIKKRDRFSASFPNGIELTVNYTFAAPYSPHLEVSGKGCWGGLVLRRGSFKGLIVTSQLLHVIPDFVFDRQSLYSWWRSGIVSCEVIYLQQVVPKEGGNLKPITI